MDSMGIYGVAVESMVPAMASLRLTTDSSWTVQMDFFRSLVLGSLRALGVLGSEKSGLIILAREHRKSRSLPSAPAKETPRSGRRVRRHRLVRFFGSAGDEHQEQEPVGDERPVNVHCSSLIPHPSSLGDASGCAAPSEAAQVVVPHKQMAIAVVRHPPEFAHLSEVCDNVDLAPTSLAQGRNASRGTSRNAPKGEKCANLCGVRTRSEALRYRSLSFSSR